MATKKVTAAAPKSILQTIINNETITARMAYLWERWQDEKEYEDFAEYVANLEMVALEQGFTLVSLTSRPFRATFQAEEGMVAVISCKAKGNKLAFDGVTEPAKLTKAKRNAKAAKMFTETIVADGAPGAAEYAAEELGVEFASEDAQQLAINGVEYLYEQRPDTQEDNAGGITDRWDLFSVETRAKVGNLVKYYPNYGAYASFIDGQRAEHAEGEVIFWNELDRGSETHEDAPSAHELEERLNDLESSTKKGVGRGYANAGKKYVHSGVRVEEFKIGKTKVKKGDKLYFKIGKEEVVGVFSHLNQCVHCPEGYAVIRFGGKNYERRQSRVSTHATEAE